MSYDVISFKSSELPKQYEALVFSKWLRSLRFGNPLFKNIETNAFYTQYHAFIVSLLKKPGSVTRMAVLSDDHDVALGFAINREDVLDYIYVQKEHRRIGIATKILPKNLTAFSHTTLVGIDIWRNNEKYRNLKFNPFA